MWQNRPFIQGCVSNGDVPFICCPLASAIVVECRALHTLHSLGTWGHYYIIYIYSYNIILYACMYISYIYIYIYLYLVDILDDIFHWIYYLHIFTCYLHHIYPGMVPTRSFEQRWLLHLAAPFHEPHCTCPSQHSFLALWSPTAG